MSRFHHDTVTVFKTASEPNGSDEDGLPAYADPVSIVLEGVQVEPVGTTRVTPKGSEEYVGNPTLTIAQWIVSTARNDFHEEISKGDKVTWRGDPNYIVDGQPHTFYSVRPHTEFVITRAEG